MHAPNVEIYILHLYCNAICIVFVLYAQTHTNTLIEHNYSTSRLNADRLFRAHTQNRKVYTCSQLHTHTHTTVHTITHVHERSLLGCSMLFRRHALEATVATGAWPVRTHTTHTHTQSSIWPLASFAGCTQHAFGVWRCARAR